MASSYGGTSKKCCACDETVYPVDQLAADGKVYHRACFRCHHCRGTLKLSNYSSYEGVLYCKPHYDQLFKMTGSLDRSFEGAPRTAKLERSIDQEGPSNNRASSFCIGTQDKCVVCKKTVYPIEKVVADGVAYHRPCFKCNYGGCVISISNYVAHEGRLYCKHHHARLFMMKGNFSKLEGKSDNLKQTTEYNHKNLEQPVEVEHENLEQPVEVEHENLKQPIAVKHENLERPVEVEHENLEQPIEVQHENLEQPIEVKHGNFKQLTEDEHEELRQQTKDKHEGLKQQTEDKHEDLPQLIGGKPEDLKELTEGKHEELKQPIENEQEDSEQAAENTETVGNIENA